MSSSQPTKPPIEEQWRRAVFIHLEEQTEQLRQQTRALRVIQSWVSWIGVIIVGPVALAVVVAIAVMLFTLL